MSDLPHIRAMHVRAARVPMPEPHRTASGVIAESPLVLVDVETDAGVIGRGLVFTYTTAALKPVATLIENLAPLAVGRPLAPMSVADDLASRFKLLGTQGLVGMALAGIDMALWDALARVHRLPLARLLGGAERPVPLYGGIGHDGPEGSARTAERWATAGLRGVKAKIGYGSVAEDLAVINAIRSAVGDDLAVMVDYNQCLSPADAVQRIREMDGLGLEWVEEPTLAHDYDGHAAIARAVTTPIQCGENWWGPLDLRHAIQAGASDFVMLDVMKIGGVTGWVRAAAIAHTHNLRVSSHLWPEVSAQLLAVTPTRHWLEYADWWNAILQEPLGIDQGRSVPSDRPGAGMDWRDDVVSRYLT